jgi:type VI protein secretion system component Hcp
MAQSNQFLKILDASESVEFFVWGESYNHKHLNEIELLGWNWGVVDPAVSTGAPAVKADEDSKFKAKSKGDRESQSGPRPSQLTFTKTLDRSTTRLLNAMNTGEIFPFAYLSTEEVFEDETSHRPFDLQIVLTKLFVVSLSLQGNSESAGVSFGESWVVGYEDISFVYQWKELNRGAIPAIFKMQPDSDEGPSQKAPNTPAEKASVAREEFDDLAKKNDWVKRSDMEEYFNTWAKKKGLLK